MRKLDYYREDQRSIFKMVVILTVLIIIFLSILQGYFYFHKGVSFDLSIYWIPLCFFLFGFVGVLLDKKFNTPITDIYRKQRDDLLNYGIRLEGEVLAIEKRLHHNFTDDTISTYYRLKIKYYSKIYDKYIEEYTPDIRNISEEDIIGPSKKCIVYEKKDTIVRDQRDVYFGEKSHMDLKKFTSSENLKKGLQVKTMLGYAFLVVEADILSTKK